MAAKTYAVIFQGRIADGTDAAAVRANLAKLFNADAGRIEKMFSGQKVIIKKGLDSEVAVKYRTVLAKAGALVDIVTMSAPVTATEKPADEATPQAAAPAAPIAADTTEAERPPVAAAPVPDPPQTVPAAFSGSEDPPHALDTSLAPPGETLIEYQHVEAPDIATDHLGMAEVGVTLVEAQVVAEPQYDLSGLTLDPPGTTLVEAPVVPVPEFDTSGMSLDENP